MDKIMYLQEEPEQDKVITFDNGVRTIPFAVIEDYLDELCDYNWSTKNFIHTYAVINNLPSISASIELEVKYFSEKLIRTEIYDNGLSTDTVLQNELNIIRTLVGAVTYPLEFFKTISGADVDSLGNQHYAASAKSLCIVNAAKSIGKRFGRDLNTNKLEIIKNDFDLGDTIDYKLQDQYEIVRDNICQAKSTKEALEILENSKFKGDVTLHGLIQNNLI